MVDRYVGAMATCLQDPHPVVRRHAILLISQLLLQVMTVQYSTFNRDMIEFQAFDLDSAYIQSNIHHATIGTPCESSHEGCELCSSRSHLY